MRDGTPIRRAAAAALFGVGICALPCRLMSLKPRSSHMIKTMFGGGDAAAAAPRQRSNTELRIRKDRGETERRQKPEAKQCCGACVRLDWKAGQRRGTARGTVQCHSARARNLLPISERGAAWQKKAAAFAIRKQLFRVPRFIATRESAWIPLRVRARAGDTPWWRLRRRRGRGGSPASRCR